MSKSEKNIDVDLDFSKIKYDDTEHGKKVDSIDVGDRYGDNNPVVISDATSRKIEPAKKHEKKIKERAVKSKSRKQSVIGAVILCMLFAVMLVMVVQSRVEISETSMKISELKDDLTSLKKERDDLNSQLESKLDMLAVEQYIQSSGMIKESGLKQVYINGDENEKVDVYESDDEILDGFFGTVLSAIYDSFVRTWNAIGR